LGEVIDLPVTLGSESIKIKALVTVNGDYDLILGNNWAHNYKAVISWTKGLLQFENQKKQIEIPITCLEKHHKTEEEDNLYNVEEEIELKVFDNNGKGKIPERAHETDAGFDLRYPETEELVISPQETVMIDSYIAIEVPKGTFSRKGIEVKAGTVDAGYTGNIKVLIHNNSSQSYAIQPDEKIAQAIFLPLVKISKIHSVSTREELGDSERGQQDEQVKALDLQVKEHYTQLGKEKFFHSTFEELKRNEVTGLDKCPHANNCLSTECYKCSEDDWYYEQIKLIPEPLYQ
ncbi:10529_t:CDS:2, partial [Racocetra fulgida]